VTFDTKLAKLANQPKMTWFCPQNFWTSCFGFICGCLT